MAQLDTLDLIVLVALLVGSIAYFTKGTYWAVPKDPYANSASNVNKSQGSRDIVQKMEESGKNCVIFYGSQTGTAEDYASRLSKEASSRYGLQSMTADLEEFEYESLDKFPSDHVAFFVMATYGEGEPTDNAVEFFEFINNQEATFSEGKSATEKPLSQMRYVTFGLGNNTYEQYNSMVRKTDEQLTKLGAKRISAAGEGDDGAGTMEEDFLAWKEPMWTELAEDMNLEEREQIYEPVFEIRERSDLDSTSDTVYLGEPNKNHLEGRQKGPYNANNPFIAPLAESKELFTDKTRNCLHCEIDITGSNLRYTTGDHIAVWPTNAGKEVDRFLRVLGLTEKKDTVFTVKGLDSTAKIPFPSPTTYDAVARYHMEICAPISRQFISSIAPFSPSEPIKNEMIKIGGDKDYFKKKVSSQKVNIGQFLDIMGEGQSWSKIPFSLFMEGIHKLQPRYYSISSSSAVQKNKISVTAIVESVEVPGAPHVVKGVTTNYLLALSEKQRGASNPDPNGLDYSITGPRNKYDGIHVPVHVRHSNFKLPSDPSTPIIMVGPGTGVAPFRAFVQERAMLAKNGEKVGKTTLFFGCRSKKLDFIYENEWKVSHIHPANFTLPCLLLNRSTKKPLVTILNW